MTKIGPREVELILRGSRIFGLTPVAEIAPDQLESYAVSPEAACDALETLPALLVTNWNGRLCTNARIDLSNSLEKPRFDSSGGSETGTSRAITHLSR